MENRKTELVFVIDRSGSMAHLTDDTVGGFNGILEKHRNSGEDVLVSVVLFNGTSEVLYDRVPISEVKEMTADQYSASGCTALLDALGGAVHHIRHIHKYIREEDIPVKTLFIVTTDGMENASHVYSSEKVKQMVTKRQEKNGWEFLFIGANIDSFAAGADLGFKKDRIANYVPDSKGCREAYMAMDACASSTIRECEIPFDWNKRLTEDYEARSKY